MSLMMLNVVFSGIGAGFVNMLMYIIVAVFLAGLMVGRTPEYLGKKVEAKEVKLAMMAILIHPLLILAGAGLFAATDWGHEDGGQPRPARLQRDPLRVHLGRGQQRLGLRGPGRQQPAPGTSPRASSCCWAASRRWSCRSRSPGSSRTKKRVPADLGHAADRQPDLRRRCCWGPCSWSVPCRSCRPSCSGPVADHLTAVKP